jgi:hypothetical protein
VLRAAATESPLFRFRFVNRTAVLLALICLLTNSATADEVADHRSVRSIAAEMAEVLRLHFGGKVSDIYTDEMKQNAREQLQDLDDSARKENPALHQAIGDSLSAMDRNDSGTLRKIAERLYGMAGPRGPAS